MKDLSDWRILRDDPVTTSADGKRSFSDPFAVHFQFPDSGFDFNSTWVTAVRDADGVVMPDRAEVWIRAAEPPMPAGKIAQEVEALDLYAPGQLHFEPLLGVPKLSPVFRGVAAGHGPGHRIGVVISCATTCSFLFYLEDHGLTLQGIMDGRFQDQALAIAAKSQALFDKWYLPNT